jgi:hypothetical protein
MTHFIKRELRQCPACKHSLNLIIGPRDTAPRTGHMVVCVYCAAPLVYGYDMNLENLRGSEFAILDEDTCALLIGYISGAVDRLVTEGIAPSGMTLNIDEKDGAVYYRLRHLSAEDRKRAIRVDRDVFALFDTEDRLAGVDLYDVARFRKMPR